MILLFDFFFLNLNISIVLKSSFDINFDHISRFWEIIQKTLIFYLIVGIEVKWHNHQNHVAPDLSYAYRPQNT